jgi:hypothetical protein
MSEDAWVPTTRLQKKITKALENKGYTCTEAFYTPIAPGGEMCGAEGGWEVDWETDTRHGHLMGYNIDEIMKEIESLPALEVQP